MASDRGDIFFNRRLAELRRLFRARVDDRRVDIDQMIFATIGSPVDWSAEELGERLGLKWTEKYQLRIRTIRCIDLSPEKVTEFYREKKRARDSERQRARRQRDNAAAEQRADLDVREEAVFAALTEAWTLGGSIRKSIAGHQAFRDGKGRSLTGDSLRRALNRAIDRLIEIGRAEGRIVAGHFGERTREVRLRAAAKIPASADEATNSCPRDSRDSRDDKCRVFE